LFLFFLFFLLFFFLLLFLLFCFDSYCFCLCLLFLFLFYCFLLFLLLFSSCSYCCYFCNRKGISLIKTRLFGIWFCVMPQKRRFGNSVVFFSPYGKSFLPNGPTWYGYPLFLATDWDRTIFLIVMFFECCV